MANRANGTVTIDVSARLQVMQSSVNELQKTLDTLEPKSARFKELSGVIQQIKREMDKVQVQTAKGFVSESQFKQTEKSLDNIEDAFAKAQLSISRIDFKDIKLDASQLATFKQFEQDLADIKTQLAATKQGIRDAFVNDAGNKTFLNSIDPTLVNKSLDQIQTAVESKMRSVNKEMQRAEEAVANYQKQIQTAADIDKFLKAGKKGNKKQGTLTYSLENALGGDAYQEFFNSNGQFKKGQRDAFFQRIQEMFMLDNAQMKQIKKLSGSKINQLFSEIIEQANSTDGTNWFDAQVKAAAKANANIANQQGIVNAKSAESQQLINFIQQLIMATDQQVSADKAAALAAQMVQQAMDGEAASITKNTKDKAQNGLATDQLSSQLSNLRQELAQTNVQFNKQQQAINTIQSIRSAITNFMGFNQVLNITRNAVREAANHIRELDKVMTNIAIVTNMTQADLWGQIDTYSKIASQYGTTIQGAYEVSQIWYQQGLQTQDVMSLTNETLKMSKISGLDYANATDYMTTAIRGFKMELSEANTVVDVYSALAASTAVSTQELAEAMTRTASSMESVGSSFQETSAMMATVIAVTRESANNIGSAFKSIASRYGEMKSDPSKLVDSEGEELAFNKVDAALKSVGITMKTTDGQFRSFTEVIMELADRWDTLTSVQQRYIATQFAGNRQQSRFLALVSNKDLLQANLQTAQSSEDAGTLQVLKTLDSLETKIEQVRVAYQQFYTTMGIENVWKTGLDALKSYINTLNSLPKLFGKIPVNAISAIMGIVNLLKGVAKSAIDGFARSWVEALSKAKGEATTASDKNLETGHNWAEKLMTGIKNYIPQIRATAQNAVREANAAAASEINKQNFNNGQNDNQLNRINALLMNQGGDNTPILNENDLDAWGYRLDYVKQQYTNLGFVLPSLTGSVEEQRDQLQKWLSTTGKIAPEMQGVTDVLSTQTKQTIKAQSVVKEYGNQWSQTLNIIGSAISSLTLLADTTTRSGELLAGAGNLAGGITSIGAGIFAAYTQNWPMAISSFISGLSSISSAIGLFYETTEERVEKLTKRAEELSNESKKSKAEANQLDTSLKKYNQLLAKRNESEEAANEFSDAVNDLANQFPQLIIGFDDAENAIIDVQSAEALLTLRRQEAAKAALDAAQAESDRIKGEQEKAREESSSFAWGVQVGASQPNDVKKYQITTKNGSFEQSTLSSNMSNDIQMMLDNRLGNLANWEEYNNATDEEWVNKVDQLAEDYSNAIKNTFDVLLEGSDAYSSDFINFYYQHIDQLEEVGLSLDPWYTSVEHQLANRFIAIKSLEPDDFKDPQVIKDITQLAQDFNTYIDSLSKQGSNIPDWAEDLRKEDSNWNKLLASLKQLPVLEQANEAADRLTAFYKISQQADQQIAEHFELVQLAAEMLYDDYVKAGYDWDKIDVTAISTANQLISDFWEDLNLQSEATAAEFLKWLNNPQTYRAEDIISFFGVVDEDVQNAIVDYMERISFDYGQAAIDAAKQYTVKGAIRKNNATTMYGLSPQKAEQVFDTQKGLQIANNEVDLYVDYLNRGLEDQARTLRTAGHRINRIMVDASDNNVKAFVVMQNLLAEGWDTTEDVTALKKKIEDAKADGTLAVDYADRLISELDTISETLIDNYLLSLSVQMDNMSKNWEADLKEFKTLSSGMSFAQQQNLILQAGQLGVSLNSSDFIPMVDGQVKLTDDALNRWLTAYYKNRYDSTLEVLSDYNETVNSLPENIDDARTFKDAKTILAHMGLDIDSANQQDYTDAIENWNKNYLLYINQIENLQKMREAQIAWMQGNYGFESADAALDALKQPVGMYAKDSVDLQKIVHLREAYNTFLNDLINEPFDEVSSKFESGWYDIDTENNKEITKLMVQGEAGIKAIVSQYAAAATQTIEEQNELIAKAIEAAEKKNRNLESATADVQWVDDKLAYASIKTATAIANALGVRVDEIVGAYDLSFNAYELHFDESQQKLIDKIDNIKQTTYDSVISYIEGITDVITSGMKGNLKGADIFNLAGQLDAREIYLDSQQKNLTYLWNNVQRTADGLKLSKEATIELYNQLKQIDAIQAQIVFKEMVDSAKETDENYQNQVTTLIRIKELEDQIDSLSPNDARFKMYQAELEVAKEIQRTRLMTDDDSWNFLDNKLPSGFANPLSFADAIANSYKAMNEGIKNKYMDPTEYYNILQQMQQMADQTNTTLHFLGHEIKAGSTDAADLINQGFKALKYVDGKGVMIDLTQLGIQVTAGSAAMAEGFDESIESIAQSQIDMLTALKNVMQGFAAMEELSQFNLDKNDNNQLELIDLFPAIDAQDFKITQETQGYLNQLFDEFLPQNKELVKFLEGITIQDQSIYYWLTQAKNNNIKNEQQANAFLTSLQWMFELGQTTDWTEDNITDIIQQISQKYGIGGQIELGEYGAWTMYGDHLIKITGQDSYLDNNGDEHGTPEEAVLANVRAEIAAAMRSMNGDRVQLSEQDNTITLGGKNNLITFQLNQNDKTVQFYYNNNGPYNSLNEAMNEAIDQQMTMYNNESWTPKQKSLQAQYDLGIKLVPTLDNPDLTNEGRNLLLQGAQAVVDEWNKGDQQEFILTYGFSLEGKAEANQSLIDSIDRILQNEGLATTPVSIAVSVANEEEQKGLVELINAVGAISRQIEVTITPKDNSPKNLGFSLNDILQAADEETKTFIMQVTGYDDTGAEASLDDLLIMQLIGKILNYNDDSADLLSLKSNALHAIIQTYSDFRAPLNNLKIMAMTALLSRYDDTNANPPTQPEVDALIGAFLPKDDTVTPDHLVSMLIATIAAYRNGKMANPNALISTLQAIITSFKDKALPGSKAADLVNALDAWISTFDGDTTSAEELINSLVAIIQQFSTGLTPEQIKEQLGLTDLGATVTVTSSGEIQITGNIDQVTAKIAELQADPNYNQMTITAKINGITTSNRTTEQWQAISQIRSDLSRVGQTGGVSILTTDDNDKQAIQEYLTLLEEFVNLGGQLESTDFTNLSALRQVSDSAISETATKLLALGTPGVFNATATEGFLNSLMSLDQSNIVETLTSIAESLEKSITSITEINTKWQAVQQTITDIQQLIFALQSIKLVPIELTYTKKENNSLMNDLQQLPTFGLLLNNNVTYTIESDGIDAFFGILIGALANLSTQTTTTGEDLGKVTTALDKISKSKGISSVGTLADKMRTIPSGKGTLVSNLAGAMSKIPDVSAKVQSLADILTKIGTEPIKLTLDITTNNPDANLSGDGVPIGETGAKGRRITIGGAAQAKGTLMGELGPELYVQGGRYYVAGQNGAEFVNLADDAIVFNHLQTKKLLSQGNTGRGKPVTSERNAVAYAAGTGPAMASASAMVAKIDNLISLWQGVLNSAQSKTLGQKAGLGGSGGGGGGGGSALNVTTTSKELETWYNLLQQIERIEAKITYQEQLRSKLESDRVANGKAYYASQKASLQALTDETQRHAQLAQEYSEYRDKLINALTTDSFYKQFYTQDEATGAIQYNAGAIEKMKRLQDTNSRGQFLHSAQEQFEIVMRDYGLTTDSDLYKKMITNDDGTQQFIMEGGKYYKTKWDEKAGQYVKDSEMTAEELTTAMEAVMEKFWTEMDATRDEITEVQKQVDEQENAVLESEEQRNELLQEIEDNMIDVQQKVYDAVEHLRQEAIDELQEQRDIISESNQAFIDGLNEQLTQEREMYNKNESDAELTKLQRQLAILQRSGGSASAIRALQDQINSKQQDMYFDERQAQIDAIQKASDNELERLDRQIELMEESLTYDKENGLLWNEVAQILTGTPEQIAQYIHENSDDYRTKSATEQEKINREDNLSIQQYTAYRDDKNKPNLLNDSEHDWEWYSNYIANTDYAKVMSDKATQNAARNAFEAKMKETGDENQAREAANAVLKEAYDKKFPKKAAEPIKEPDFVPPPTTSGSSGSGSSGSGSSGNTTPPPPPKKEYLNISYKVYCSTGPAEGQSTGGTCTGPYRLEVGKSAEIKCTVKDGFAYGGWAISDTSLCSRNGNTITALKAGSVTITRKFWDQRKSLTSREKFRLDSQRNPVNPNKLENGIGYDNLQEYSSGGLANYTGLAMVHGSKRKPEAFIDADTTRIWKEKILNGNNSLTSLLANLQEHWSALPTTSQYESINSSTDNSAAVNIENATVEMHVDSIANDYDARRAGQSALEEIMKIARKSGTLATNRG